MTMSLQDVMNVYAFALLHSCSLAIEKVYNCFLGCLHGAIVASCPFASQYMIADFVFHARPGRMYKFPAEDYL